MEPLLPGWAVFPSHHRYSSLDCMSRAGHSATFVPGIKKFMVTAMQRKRGASDNTRENGTGQVSRVRFPTPPPMLKNGQCHCFSLLLT